MRNHTYYVYIVASWTKVLYIGVTNYLAARLYQHRNAGEETYAGRYRTHRLVYIEEFSRIDNAIAREKQLKGWKRDRKIALVESKNSGWRDLSEDWA